MFHVIAILYTLFWSFPSDDIDVSYNSALEAIVINGLDKNELKDSDYDVSVYFGVVSVSPEIPKIIGNYESVASQTLYKSKYGFSNGTSYTVLITSNNKSKSQYRFVVTIPKETLNSSTYVTMVYPTTDKLPMNQLKLYISFSESMKTGNAFEYIHLYKMPEGKLEEDAFLKFSDELWDTQRKRLTILFDPGRIKPGLQPNLQMGLPLVEGQKYKLVIDESWLDNNGAQLVKGYEKTFEVIAQDKTAPNKDNWEISFPKQDSKNPIVIDFKESMDYGLLQNSFHIVAADNNLVKGEIILKNHESIWSFIPESPWNEGEYKIVIDAWLEDLAGNSLRRKFDVDLTNPLDNPNDIKEVLIPFEIN